LQPLAVAFADVLALWRAGGDFAAIRARWLSHAMPLGTSLRVTLASGAVNGAFSGLDACGNLLLQTAQGVETISAGDVGFGVDKNGAL